ncbi:carbon-nitrogen hydrolase family protein [Thermobifida fusca]|jgi:deaminated glutathione amidase|uniref:Hydrolase n=2 Tax=Thermobifida fusca TaxID=2021 RepID=A0A9P2TC99_THEFU|nr:MULTISPECIES: carbon-nitrogen hydrolase family protein [Thermobifida]AAZ54727.1 putative hydrolase [Thermobifida fusca YX]EOR72238.1 hydrolase [Thermobifida fusca TM51]MBO2529414.1 hydrolase [Thermobifida sp.]MDD6793237.1 carbon-nitrogen hydrolase family protein [Thermobifida fusca]PPS96467.1 hydrolase [Thermobifida fusca]
MVGVAVAQFAPGMDKQANLRRAVELVRAAVDQGARLVVLPEYAMFTAPATDHRFVAAAEPLDGRYVSGLRDLARDCGVYLVAGVNEAVDDPERFANTTVAVGPDGALLVCYRKLHLYDAFGFTESAVVRPGEITDPAVFTVDGLTFGVQTCYDLRFPEVTRRLADAGAHAVVLGAEWVPGPEKKEHWKLLVRARAVENTLYVAAAGQTAPMGSGHSMVADPMGVVVASLADDEGVAVAAVDPARVAEVRALNPVLELRRFTVAPKYPV